MFVVYRASVQGLTCPNIGTRVGYRITSDGAEEDGGAEGTATNTEMPSDTGACAEDGEICSDSYNITDGNPTQAGGEIAMDSHGSLSLQIQGCKSYKSSCLYFCLI